MKIMSQITVRKLDQSGNEIGIGYINDWMLANTLVRLHLVKEQSGIVGLVDITDHDYYYVDQIDYDKVNEALKN